MAHMAAGAVATLGGRFELLGPILAEQTESISAPPAKSARKSIASSIECVDRIYGSKSRHAQRGRKPPPSWRSRRQHPSPSCRPW